MLRKGLTGRLASGNVFAHDTSGYRFCYLLDACSVGTLTALCGIRAAVGCGVRAGLPVLKGKAWIPCRPYGVRIAAPIRPAQRRVPEFVSTRHGNHGPTRHDTYGTGNWLVMAGGVETSGNRDREPLRPVALLGPGLVPGGPAEVASLTRMEP